MIEHVVTYTDFNSDVKTEKKYFDVGRRNGKSLSADSIREVFEQAVKDGVLKPTIRKIPEITQEDIDKMLQSSFDTTGFIQRQLYAALMKGENNMNNVMNDIVFGKPVYLVTESGRVPVKIDNCTMSTLEPASFEGHVLTPAEDYICRDAYTMHELAKKFVSAYKRKPRTNEIPAIKNVIFSGPCTIVLWEDGTKTVVRCNNDVLDPEKGLAMAIAKKAMGTNKSGSNYYDIFKKWLPKAEEEKNDG